MSVVYQVERRPIGPDGKVYRGLQSTDYVAVPTNSNPLYQRFPNGLALTGVGLGTGSTLYPPNAEFSNYDASKSTSLTSNMIEVSGEPWLVHSTNFSIESALASASPLSAAIGTDNVRIVKVLSHELKFKLK